MKLNVTLNEETSKRFQEVKEHMGVVADRSVIELLISREKDRIWRSRRRKLFLPNEVYDEVEKAAKALNLTIDEYIDSVTGQLLRKTSNARAQTAEEHIDEAAENLLKNTKIPSPSTTETPI